MFNQGLRADLTPEDLAELRIRAHRARGTVLTATTLASSGHPGGSFSSMEIYTLLYSMANLRPDEPRWEGRDRIVISHGHTSPGVYAALAESGFFLASEVAAHFRQAGSIFEGHVERSVPGAEWSSGNLGQGLSAGVGLALGARLTGARWHTFVAMSDAEQHKGQVAEARRLAVKERIANLTVVVDWNRVQISGHTDEVMPVPLVQDWLADGWRVVECDGHDLAALAAALADGANDGLPTVVLAHTVIGKGVSFMEDLPEFHGRGLTAEEYPRAMAELGLDPSALEEARGARLRPCAVVALDHMTPPIRLVSSPAIEYAAEKLTDNRSAWGAAVVSIAQANIDVVVAVIDCDLAQSVKTDAFGREFPEHFIECGVGEHNAATMGGALSTVPGVLAFWADFGVFGIDEAYNQQRLNDINGAALKLVVTHCGLDVGEDGKTHQCLDYIGAFREFFGWRVLVPADPNQTDRCIRAAAQMPGNVAVAMGRSKLQVILAEDGSPLFGGGYVFEPGEVVWARRGADAAMLVTGTLAGAAVDAADQLASEGTHVGVGIIATPLEIAAEALRHAAEAPLFTVEDHNVHTGLGVTVRAWLGENGLSARLTTLGVAGYQSSGSSADLFGRVGLDAAGIASRVRRELHA